MDFEPTGPTRRTQPETSLEADRRRAFLAARRHTAMVRALRLSFPVLAIGLVLAYAGSLLTSWSFGSGNIRIGQIEITPDDLTMRNPSYFGMTKDGGRYEVRAQRARMGLNQSEPIKLFDIDGDLVQPSNGTKTLLKARHGLFDNVKSELELFDGIEIDSTNGMKARMSRATIYTKDNRVVSKQPVHVSSATGDIRGASMTMNTATNQATFQGNVAVRLAPAEEAAQAQAQAQTPAAKSRAPAAAAATTPAFGRDSRQPINVRSERLDVDDGAHTALFTGSVVAVQGDSVLRAPEMHVAYEGRAADELTNPGASQTAGADQSSSVTRLVAKTNVVITMGADRKVVSEIADFNTKADTALFIGGVIVNQGRNILQGRRLFLDRKAGRTKLDSPAEASIPAGRITAVFYQEQPAQAPGAKAKATDQRKVEQNADAMVGTFKADPNAPMDVEADTLEVFETAHQAVFKGSVKAQQGDFMVRGPEMVAYYTGQAGLGASGAPAGAQDSAGAQITRIEVRQKALITSKDGQTATGDWATFDVKANTVLMGGHVVVTRGKDVAQGPRLKIDLTTGFYRFELDDKAAAQAAHTPQQLPALPQPKMNANGQTTAAQGDSIISRPCPPGKQCVLFYPKEAQDKAKNVLEKQGGPAAGWEPSTSASQVQRGN